MSNTPLTPKPKLSPAKLERQARLNAALRANLRRRKGPENTSDKVAEPEDESQTEATDGIDKAE